MAPDTVQVTPFAKCFSRRTRFSLRATWGVPHRTAARSGQHGKQRRRSSRSSGGGDCAPQKYHPVCLVPDFSRFSVSAHRPSPRLFSLGRRRLPKRSTRGASRPAQISLAGTHPASIDIEVRPSRCVQIRGRAGYTRAQCAVRASTVVVSHPLSQDRAQVRLGHREHPVQALPPNGADHPLADRVRLQTRDGRSQHFDAQGSDRMVQVLGEDRVTIVDQVLVAFGISDDLSQLLQRRGRTRLCRHVHVRQAARAVLDDDKHVQHPKRRRDGYEEVAGEDSRGLIPQECRPAQVAAGSPGRPLRQVLAHGSRRCALRPTAHSPGPSCGSARAVPLGSAAPTRSRSAWRSNC
jgi:hypothetical protein